MSNLKLRSKKNNQESSDEGDKKPLYPRVKADLKKGWVLLKRFVRNYFLLIVLLLTGSLGILNALGIHWIVPEHLQGYAILWGYGTWFGLLPGELLRQYISDDTKEYLFSYHSKSSKLAKWAIPPAILDKVDFVDPDGDPMDIDDADIIHTREHGMAYLVQEFDEDELTAVTTWLAGKNPIDLRADKEELNEAVTVTWKMAESAIKVLSQRENISREAALKEILTNIENREDINLESTPRQTDIEGILQDNDILQDDIIQDIQDEMGDSDE